MIAPEPHERGVRLPHARDDAGVRRSSSWTRDGRSTRRTMALAEWVATITDLPFADPCNAAVERNSIRLEREADNWRER